MALNTYTTLIAGLQAWVEDDDSEFTGSINDVLDLAELRLTKDLDLALFRRTDSTAVMSIGSPNVTKPTIGAPNVLIATKVIYLTNGGLTVFPQLRGQDYCVDYEAGVSANGVPKYWAEASETTYFITPRPALAWTVNVRYLSRPPQLTPSNQTNWLSTYAYDLLFKAALAEAEKFLKSDERAPIWEADYVKSMPTTRRQLYQQYQNQYDRLGATPLPNLVRSLAQ